jgi:DNA adenine methylase
MKNIPVSPLRYPGGKSSISSFIEDLINLNNINNCTLYELYAGGAGASLNILFSGVCKRIVLNDLDYHVYSFWASALNHTEEFIKLIEKTPIDMENWILQKDIYDNYKSREILEVGFSTFFLNRCNRSGILQAGPIGGKDQTGNYKIDVRFNKRNLIERIQILADKKDLIEIRNTESLEFLEEIFSNEKEPYFIFLDPPYYVQGENLYYNFYNDSNHTQLANLLKDYSHSNWFLTYDNCERIKELYSDFRTAYLPMTYTLQEKKKSKEIMVFSDNLYLPRNLRLGNKSEEMAMIKSN